MAQADCLTAQNLGQQATVVAANRTPERLERYTVQRDDTLWGISAQRRIYHNPFMWPLLYQANRAHIHDPDRIFPAQTLIVPRDYSREAAETPIQRARQRGSWRLRNGPDAYILEGLKR